MTWGVREGEKTFPRAASTVVNTLNGWRGGGGGGGGEVSKEGEEDKSQHNEMQETHSVYKAQQSIHMQIHTHTQAHTCTHTSHTLSVL